MDSACPQSIEFTHTEFDKYQTFTRAWGLFENALNCKMVIKADGKLNGKLRVDIIEAKGTTVTTYLMPNKFSDKYGF